MGDGVKGARQRRLRPLHHLRSAVMRTSIGHRRRYPWALGPTQAAKKSQGIFEGVGGAGPPAPRHARRRFLTSSPAGTVSDMTDTAPAPSRVDKAHHAGPDEVHGLIVSSPVMPQVVEGPLDPPPLTAHTAGRGPIAETRQRRLNAALRMPLSPSGE